MRQAFGPDIQSNTNNIRPPSRTSFTEEFKMNVEDVPDGLDEVEKSGFGLGPSGLLKKGDEVKTLDVLPEESNRSANERICRICFSEDHNPKEDPLISPCMCSGSMKWVHLKCLQKWLGGNQNKKIHPHVTTYTWKAFHCELCRQKLDDHYHVNDRIHSIFSIDKPATNYIVIESCQVSQSDTDTKKLVSTVDIYEGDFSTLRVVANRFQDASHAFLLDMDFWEMKNLRPVQTKPLARTGDSEKVQILTEYTLCSKNEKASGAIYDLTTSS